MRILFPTTTPPNQPIQRRHRPRKSSVAKGYKQYRSCARWDFGFQCGFCLLHESDFSRTGQSEGTALTTIEHVIPVSTDSTKANLYSNCVYCCRLCNTSRRIKATIDALGRELLDPTARTWAVHFTVAGSELVPVDRHARYTAEAYQLNDRRKRGLRERRDEVIKDRLFVIRDGASKIPKALALAGRLTKAGYVDEARELIEQAAFVRARIGPAIRDLQTYQCVPGDAPRNCRCMNKRNHTLAAHVQAASMDIGSLIAAAATM